MDEKELETLSKEFIKLMLQFYCSFQEFPENWRKFKLNSLSFNILFRLYSSKETKLTIMELTDRMQISKPQLIKLINNLENENLVLRERFKENRRIVYLSLSEEGRLYMEQILECMAKNFAGKLQQRDADTIKGFAEGVDKLAMAIDA